MPVTAIAKKIEAEKAKIHAKIKMAKKTKQIVLKKCLLSLELHRLQRVKSNTQIQIVVL